MVVTLFFIFVHLSVFSPQRTRSFRTLSFTEKSLRNAEPSPVHTDILIKISESFNCLRRFYVNSLSLRKKSSNKTIDFQIVIRVALWLRGIGCTIPVGKGIRVFSGKETSNIVLGAKYLCRYGKQINR